MAQRSEDEKK